MIRIRSLGFALSLPLALTLAAPLAAQVQVVDMIPFMQSDETNGDAEPNLAVDPANPLRQAASAFMFAAPMSNLGPVLVTTDGGSSWGLGPIVPTCMGCFNTGDMTLRFAVAGANPNQADLYASILSNAVPGMVVMRTFDQSLTTGMTTMEGRTGTDQPYIQARGVVGWFDPGKERIYVGISDRALGAKSATVDHSLDAAAGAPAFTTTQIDAGNPVPFDNYQTRPAVAADGHVYAAFYRRLTSVLNTGYTADVVVVRDDDWGKPAAPYTSLKDSGMPAVAGQRVASAVTVTDDCCCGGSCSMSAPVFPGQRQGGDLFLAVDPNDAAVVYISWADRPGGDPMTLHLRRSTDFGQSWPGPDLLTVASAKNAAIAVNSQGHIGYLYQQWTGTAPNHRWQTHLRRFASGAWSDDLLSNMPCEWNGNSTTCGWTGDYDYLAAAGKSFYGVFSASNDPATLAAGTIFLRNHDGAVPPHLLKTDNTAVANSVDPFFFRTVELSTDADFYVRDWTDDAATHDHGLEPSSHPDFFSTSDVWNERTNDPLAFGADDRPQSHDPQPMLMGTNFAFVRVSRETGGGAADVGVDFFFSDGGVGVAYQSAGSTTVHFNAGDTQVTIPAGSGVQWNLPSGMSNHVCLAAQLHTAADPFIPPTLLGRAPGWPSGTDLAVLNDNNKAQRNMQVFGMGGMGGGMAMFALAHNAARIARDMTIGIDVDGQLEENLANARVEIADPREPRAQPLRPHSTLTLAKMQPGEDRWLAVRGDLQDAPAGGSTAIRVYEVAGEQILNGYAFLPRRLEPKEVASRNAFQQAVVFARAAELYKEPRAAQGEKAARAAAANPAVYFDFLKKETPSLQWLAGYLLARQGADPLRLKDSLQAFLTAGSPDAHATAHLSLLNAIDAQETMLRRAKR